jgi:hypothetical protein
MQDQPSDQKIVETYQRSTARYFDGWMSRSSTDGSWERGPSVSAVGLRALERLARIRVVRMQRALDLLDELKKKLGDDVTGTAGNIYVNLLAAIVIGDWIAADIALGELGDANDTSLRAIGERILRDAELDG